MAIKTVKRLQKHVSGGTKSREADPSNAVLSIKRMRHVNISNA